MILKFIKNYLYVFIIGIFIFISVPVFASNINGTISTNQKYAFGDKLGWLNFGCDNCGVHITDTKLSGYVWSKQYGWVNLSPEGNIGVTNNCLGQLGGKAWSKSLGWLDFSGAQIDSSGKFIGATDGGNTKAGKINFSCTNCGVSTDWLQCSLRESPAQVVINGITDNTIPSISANITITNEGNIDTEYQYEWCVVSDISNSCGGGDDIFYASGAKLITSGSDWTVVKDATVPSIGTYYFKLVAHYGINYSTASQIFTAITAIGGGNNGGGSSGGDKEVVSIKGPFDTADFNRDHSVDSIDFSILLYFWKKNPPFKNIYVDINKDNKVDSVDFSIMLSQWGRKNI
jgi:hypothetical protein